MEYLHTTNLGDIPNPHTNKRGRVHMRYEHALTPDEKAAIQADLSVGEKLEKENTYYKEKSKGRKDLGCDSSLESLYYATLTRFGAEVKMHPYGEINFGNGTIYDPDMLATLTDEKTGAEYSFFGEPHTVKNRDKDYHDVSPFDPASLRIIQSTILNKAYCLCEAMNKPVLIFKPNFYFQIVEQDSTGEARLYPENRSALCYCVSCRNLFPTILPLPTKCPVCQSDDFKAAFFGDREYTGAIAIKGNQRCTALDIFCEASECAVTTPVKGEIRDDLEFRDTYGTPLLDVS